VEGLVDEVLRDDRDHQDVAGVRVQHGAERERERRAERHEGEERPPREEDDAPFPRRAHRHLVIGEVLVVLARMPVVDGAQRPDVDQPVHDALVDPPLEQVGEEEHRDDEQPFPARALQARHAPADDRETDDVDDPDVHRSAVKGMDLRLVLPPELELALRRVVNVDEPRHGSSLADCPLYRVARYIMRARGGAHV
jgi:hypothetical protein